jgi:hypothetical protein
MQVNNCLEANMKNYLCTALVAVLAAVTVGSLVATEVHAMAARIDAVLVGAAR